MPTTPTAATVRAYFQGDEKRLARLSEAAAKTVQPGARGRLHPDAIKAFNVKRRKDARYVLGASTEQAKAAKASAVALREQAAEAGFKVGERGPLPKAFLATVK